MSTVMGRPPRPKAVDPDLIRHAAKRMGMHPFREVVHVVPDPDSDGLIAETKDGHLHLVPVEGPTVRYLPPRLRPGQEQTNEPWTVEDLDQEADRITIGTPNVPWAKWASNDPIRAWAYWRHLAATANTSMPQIAIADPVASEMRRIVLASGWLSPTDAAQLWSA